MRINLRLKRVGENLSAQQLADRLKISRTAYCAIENGSKNPSWTTIKKIADYFKLEKIEELKKILEVKNGL